LINEGTVLLPPERAKTRAVFLAYEASSLLKSREVDAVADAARAAYGMAERPDRPPDPPPLAELRPRSAK